jgi:mevalonate pyrophosphate decarboxylase
VMTSPFLACRLAYIPTVVDDFRRAITGGDFSALGLLAERDSLSLHAVTMTGEAGMLHWQPATVAVFHEVRAMRGEGLECYFSVDTGATPYVNCRPEDAAAVQARVAALGIETALGHIGGPARLDEGHLF